MNYANATSRRSPTVWKLLNNAGYTVGTMNIPFTYPPEPLNGFQISGMDTPSENSPFIHPPALREDLVKHLGEIQLDLRFLGAMSTDERRSQVLAEMEQMDKQWTKAALYLLENHPQDVMMFVFMTAVREGLKEGEKVVTVGQLYLNNNDKVRTTEKSLEK